MKRPFQSSKPERSAWHWPEQAGAFALAVALFVTLGPFGTFEMPLPQRALYWSIAFAAGWFFVSATILALRRLGILHIDAPVAHYGLAIIAAALPTSVAALFLESVMRPETGQFWLPGVFFYVTVVCLTVGSAVIAFVRARFSEPVEAPVYAGFFKRLPAHLGTNLISLSSQDHYVEVTTDLGRELLHMRLGDALEELSGYPGQQIHRSHWIAARAFLGTTRENNRLAVQLSDGRTLPVSRSFASDVRAMTPLTPAPPE